MLISLQKQISDLEGRLKVCEEHMRKGSTELSVRDVAILKGLSVQSIKRKLYHTKGIEPERDFRIEGRGKIFVQARVLSLL